jgi:hypothetical protein
MSGLFFGRKPMLGKAVLLLCFIFLAVSCGHKKDAKEFEKILEQETGQNHTLAKLDTETGKYVVFYNESTGVYTAYNMDKFDRKEMTNYSQFLANTNSSDIVSNLAKFDEWVEDGYYRDIYDDITFTDQVYDSGCHCYKTHTFTERVKVGEEWVDTSHWYTYFTGGGFKFDNTSSLTKDLEMIGAMAESEALKRLGEKLQSQFSLSSDRATELSSLMMKYQKLDTTRELTAQEKDQFALKSLGVTVSRLERALKEKDQTGSTLYNDLLTEAAILNRTSPEQMGKILDEALGFIQ